MKIAGEGHWGDEAESPLDRSVEVGEFEQALVYPGSANRRLR